MPATLLIGFFLLGIEEIGIQTEEPFSILPLEALCNGAIATTLDELLTQDENKVFDLKRQTALEAAEQADKPAVAVAPAAVPVAAAAGLASFVRSAPPPAGVVVQEEPELEPESEPEPEPQVAVAAAEPEAKIEAKAESSTPGPVNWKRIERNVGVVTLTNQAKAVDSSQVANGERPFGW